MKYFFQKLKLVKSDQRGVALYIVLTIVLLVTLITVLLNRALLNAVDMMAGQRESIQAYYAAEEGVERVKAIHYNTSTRAYVFDNNCGAGACIDFTKIGTSTTGYCVSCVSANAYVTSTNNLLYQVAVTINSSTSVSLTGYGFFKNAIVNAGGTLNNDVINQAVTVTYNPCQLPTGIYTCSTTVNGLPAPYNVACLCPSPGPTCNNATQRCTTQ